MSGPDSAEMRFVWIDCEVCHVISPFSSKMTGLNLGKDKIIEIAAVITNKDLKLLDPHGFERVIHCPESMMTSMDEWCTEQHRKVILQPNLFH
jgi:oligoribonuclease